MIYAIIYNIAYTFKIMILYTYVEILKYPMKLDKTLSDILFLKLSNRLIQMPGRPKKNKRKNY